VAEGGQINWIHLRNVVAGETQHSNRGSQGSFTVFAGKNSGEEGEEFLSRNGPVEKKKIT